MDGPQDWTGYDFLKVDLYTDAKDPWTWHVEVRDTPPRDYWTRVNYNTVVPPGAEHARRAGEATLRRREEPPRPHAPARQHHPLRVRHPGEAPGAAVSSTTSAWRRDRRRRKVLFDGLYAFDFGTGTSPVMDGFTRVTPATLYSKGRGYGLQDAQVWRAFDVLQPDPLYQDFICIESGGLAVDVPNGRYHVFVNMDSPSGFWGEYQVYREARHPRRRRARGRPTPWTAPPSAKKYFRFWDVEDLPAENTFDKYQKAYFQEKKFDVEVNDGQLNLDFQGTDWACSVSAVVVFPPEQGRAGRALPGVRAGAAALLLRQLLQARAAQAHRRSPRRPRRRTRSAATSSSPATTWRTSTTTTRPSAMRPASRLTAEAFAGEYEPVTLAVLPLQDLGQVTVTASDLAGPKGKIPAERDRRRLRLLPAHPRDDGGLGLHDRPRLIMPTNAVAMPKGVVRRFWLTVKVPADAKPGVYQGTVTIAPEQGAGLPRARASSAVRNGTLDAVDIPAGPWGYTIGLPWSGETRRPASGTTQMARKSLSKLREYGFTTFTGLPIVSYQGFKDGKPVFDFPVGDAQMKMAREAGFTMPVVDYAAFGGLTSTSRTTPR